MVLRCLFSPLDTNKLLNKENHQTVPIKPYVPAIVEVQTPLKSGR